MMLFKCDNFLSKKDLQTDCLYLWKDGHVRLFLGVDNNGKLVFYTLGILDLYFKESAMAIRHEDVALFWLKHSLKTLVSCVSLELDAIERYATMPSIYACLENKIVSKYGGYPNIVSFCTAFKNQLGVIQTGINLPRGTKYVAAKDLVVGGIYHTGEDCHRKTYCFMGRGGKTGDFIWMFVSRDDVFRKDPFVYFREWHPDIDIQHQNKRVRPVTLEKNGYLGDWNAAQASKAFADMCRQYCSVR